MLFMQSVGAGFCHSNRKYVQIANRSKTGLRSLDYCSVLFFYCISLILRCSVLFLGQDGRNQICWYLKCTPLRHLSVDFPDTDLSCDLRMPVKPQLFKLLPDHCFRKLQFLPTYLISSSFCFIISFVCQMPEILQQYYHCLVIWKHTRPALKINKKQKHLYSMCCFLKCWQVAI